MFWAGGISSAVRSAKILAKSDKSFALSEVVSSLKPFSIFVYSLFVSTIRHDVVRLSLLFCDFYLNLLVLI